jgi:hypothetical protein
MLDTMPLDFSHTAREVIVEEGEIKAVKMAMGIDEHRRELSRKI